MVEYPGEGGKPVAVVDGVTLDVLVGETLGVVGESGSGKTTLALSLLGLLPQPARAVRGSIKLRDEELLGLPESRLEVLRGAEVSLIFQEPGIALNPVMRVGDQIAEVLRAHRPWNLRSILAFGAGDADPNVEMNIWLSSGPSHLWNPAQTRPATPWEAEIDRLMRLQLTTVKYEERKRLYDRVQQLVAENLPMIPLVAPRILVGAKTGLMNFRPAILDHYTLWNVDELFWHSKAPGLRGNALLA